MPWKGKKPSQIMGQITREYQEFLKNVPTHVGREAENFFKHSFRQQGFSGESQMQWKQRKDDRDRGRAILVKSSRLRNSIRILEEGHLKVIVGSELPYAEVHNEGFAGTVQVGEHSRTASRRVHTRFNKSGRGIGKKKRIRGRDFRVRAHSRRMNVPGRPFIGNSPYLDKRIARIIEAGLRKISNNIK